MLQIGCHLSSVKGFEHMGEEALSIETQIRFSFSPEIRGAARLRISILKT